MIGAIAGFVTREFWLFLGGWLFSITFKMWFADCVVWIYEVTQDATPEYRKWHGIIASTENGLET
jgi:hypothetical protein